MHTLSRIFFSVYVHSSGCDDEGVCRPVGHKKMTPTCMVYECRFNDEFKDSFYTLSGQGLFSLLMR